MKIATIGTGIIVEHFIRAARTVDDIDFVAVYSRNLVRGHEFAEKVSIDKVYTSLTEMFSDNEIDTIYIASPNSLHYEQTKLALLSGKNVIVEKPFTGNYEKALELVTLSKDLNLYLFEAICNIHMPHFEYIKEKIDKVGKIKLIQCNYSQYSSRYSQLLQGTITNVFDPNFSGGALADINIYNLHFVIALCGMPDKVSYIANCHENGIDTSGVVILKYPDYVVECVGAKDSYSSNFAQIQGETGYIMIPGGVNGLKRVEIDTTGLTENHNVQDRDRLSYQVEAFRDIIMTKDRARCDELLEHSLNVVKVAEKARQDINLNFEF
ncbi:MAG: Gfo/Idh/MocA family oxidoreductase [Erysipelothrix sp.]